MICMLLIYCVIITAVFYFILKRFWPVIEVFTYKFWLNYRKNADIPYFKKKILIFRQDRDKKISLILYI